MAVVNAEMEVDVGQGQISESHIIKKSQEKKVERS